MESKRPCATTAKDTNATTAKTQLQQNQPPHDWWIACEHAAWSRTMLHKLAQATQVPARNSPKAIVKAHQKPCEVPARSWHLSPRSWHLSPRALVVAMRLKLQKNGDGKHTFKIKIAEDGSDLIDKACEIFVVSRTRLIIFYDDEGCRVRPEDCEDGDIVYVEFEGGEFLPASMETCNQ